MKVMKEHLVNEHQIEVNHGHKEEEEMGRDMLTSIY